MTASNVTIIIDRKPFEVTPGLVSGQLLLNLSGVMPPSQLLFEVHGDIDIPVTPRDFLLIRGGEHFSIGDGCPPIEENPCLRHPIHIHLNGVSVPAGEGLHRAKLLGSQIRAFDPTVKPSDGLFADLPGLADEPIKDDQRLIVQKRDHFITVPCGNVGEGPVISDHVEELRSQFPGAALTEQGSSTYALIPEVAIPGHWGVSTVTMLLLVPNGYPIAALDMFWVSPELRLRSGAEPNGGNTYEDYLGRRWQRFSWHYGDQKSAWVPGKSSLLSHVRFALARLHQEM